MQTEAYGATAVVPIDMISQISILFDHTQHGRATVFTLRDSVSLLSIVAIGCQGRHFLETIDQRRLSAVLTTDDAQFETLPYVRVDLLFVKTRPYHSKNVDRTGAVLIEHLGGYGWLHQGIVPYLQFSRGHDVVG